jgi:bifunctional non-homologous end joining protein LigD
MTLETLITHPDKVFWPHEGYTKLDLARFYDIIFPRLQPFVKDRLLALERCPDGTRGECFFEKEAPKAMPDGTPTKLIHHENRSIHYVVGGSRDTQISLVNLGCIAVHIWGSRADHPRQPDWAVFDLDPTSGNFADAAQAGQLLRAALESINVTSFPKTSGGRGLHVFVPIQVGPDFEEARTFVEEVSKQVAAAHPDLATVEQRLDARRGRVYFDPLRNCFGATVAAPYAVRRREKAPFSMPLSWAEVKPSVDPSSFNLGNFEKVLGGRNAWHDFFDQRQSLRQAARALHRS